MVRGALTQTEVATAEARIWGFLGQWGALPDDPMTWNSSSISTEAGEIKPRFVKCGGSRRVCNLMGIGQNQGCWEVRAAPGVQAAFREYW